MSATIAAETGVLAADALRDITRGIAKNVPVADLATAIPPSAWSVLTDGGWDLLGVPEDAGGAGLDLRDLVEVALAWGEQILPLPLLPTILAKRWSPAARESPCPVTYAVAEPAGPTATFAAFPDVRLLTGSGVVQPAPKSIEDFSPTLGKGAVASATALTGEARHEAAVLVAAEAVGCASRMLADATAYATTREQFGQPIGRFQAIKHHLADAYAARELAITAVAWAAQEPTDYATPVRIAVTDAQRSAELSNQVFGGIGFTWEMGIHFFLRHIISLRATADALLADTTSADR